MILGDFILVEGLKSQRERGSGEKVGGWSPHPRGAPEAQTQDRKAGVLESGDGERVEGSEWEHMEDV